MKWRKSLLQLHIRFQLADVAFAIHCEAQFVRCKIERASEQWIKNCWSVFCFLCHVLKVVSSFERNVLSTDCTLSTVAQKPDDEITSVFTNEHTKKKEFGHDQTPISVSRYKLLRSDPLGSRLRDLKRHVLEDESGACTCVQWKQWPPQKSFCIEVEAAASPLLSDLRLMTLSNLIFPDGAEERLSCSWICYVSPNLTCRLAIIMSPIALF